MRKLTDSLAGLDVTAVNRRDLIRKALKVGGLAYVAPMIVASVQPAAAQASGNPNPQCVGASCGNFVGCSNVAPGCLCLATSTGGGLCADGGTACGGLVSCTGIGNTCPAGSLCVVNTCCGGPVCAPPSAFCVASVSGGVPTPGPHGTLGTR